MNWKVSDLIGIVGFAVLVAGVAGYDWRIACIVGGGLPLIGSVFAILRSE